MSVADTQRETLPIYAFLLERTTLNLLDTRLHYDWHGMVEFVRILKRHSEPIELCLDDDPQTARQNATLGVGICSDDDRFLNNDVFIVLENDHKSTE